MQSNLLIAFAGGVLLASVAFYVSSRPAVTANAPAVAPRVEAASTVVPVATSAPAPEVLPIAQPAPVPVVTPAPKRKTVKAVKTARQFDPRPLTVAAAPDPVN